MADNLNIRDMGKFEEHDQNDVFDDSMKRYQAELEKAVQNDGREDAQLCNQKGPSDGIRTGLWYRWGRGGAGLGP